MRAAAAQHSHSGRKKEGGKIELQNGPKSLTVMLAIANAMASHAGLASPLLSVNKHGG
jgi:hypothetical protein